MIRVSILVLDSAVVVVVVVENGGLQMPYRILFRLAQEYLDGSAEFLSLV